MSTSLRKPVGVGIIAGALTALAVFGGTGAFLAAAQDTPDTTIPESESPDTTVAPETTAPSEDDAPSAEDRRARREEWRQCMADNGVDLPEPQLGENGRPVRPSERPQLDDAQREAFKSAVDVCGRPPLHRGHGPDGRADCEPGEQAPDGSAPDQSTPDDAAPSAEGSSYAA